MACCDGVVVIDKPRGMTSARVVAEVKRGLAGPKVGHAGTLDPDATGVLICCVGAATRLARFLMRSPKTYRAMLVLGVETATQDASGEVTATRALDGVTADAVHRTAARFTGAITQVPPAFSALKHKGVPLYRLARQGRPVTKPPRPVMIHRLTVLEVALPQVHMEVVCSAGTYVRTLCADLGRDLGCGGHLAALRRTAGAGFDIEEAVALDMFTALCREGRGHEQVIATGRALRGMPSVTVNLSLVGRINAGQHLGIAEIGPPPGSGEIQVLFEDRVLAVIQYNEAAGRYDYVCVLPYQP
jgi:tRNA pseudouridine55 synthase